MLVLTRKPNQQLRIGNDIVITVVKIRGNTIRLGIEAPKDVRIMRSELEPKPICELNDDSTPSDSAADNTSANDPSLLTKTICVDSLIGLAASSSDDRCESLPAASRATQVHNYSRADAVKAPGPNALARVSDGRKQTGRGLPPSNKLTDGPLSMVRQRMAKSSLAVHHR